MRWLKTDKKLEPDTQRWKDLHDCLRRFANDMWSYYVEIDGTNWDLQKIQMQIAAVQTDLQLAEKIWPEGKSILVHLSQCVVRLIEAREEEHYLATHQVPRDFKNLRKLIKENSRSIQVMEDVWKKIELIGEGMWDCCDKIKKWTSIDVRQWLEAEES